MVETIMTEHYNWKSHTDLRRMLRRNLSNAEAIVWKHLSRRQVCGYKFRRQYGIDRYVIDFYCPELKLAIEIDGDSHSTETAQANDRNREKHIRNYGVTFLRFTNSDVLQNLNGVLEKIHGAIESMQDKY